MRARIESSVASRRAAQATVDACMVAIAYSMAYVLRFDPSIPHRYQVLLEESIAFVVVGKVAVFALFRLYHRLWRFVDQQDFEQILKAVLTATVALVAISYAIPSKVVLHLPRGVIALDFLLTLGLVGGVRFLVRAVLERPFRGPLAGRGAREVLIVGAGNGDLLRQVREVQVEAVLGPEPVRVEIDRVGAYLSGQVVLVTGAGGSIGAELCRQISRVGVKNLVLVDNAENSLFEIRRELERDRHFTRTLAMLADCKDAVRMGEIFSEHRPDVVFHAAAYKHVPLMEENPVEAVRNNAVATRIVAAAAGSAGAKRFVLVSTDKAVSPATVMGASKALAEWALEAAQHRFRETKFATVRFGNVLGSSGSVVPIFRRQIAAGGPLTVTDPAMTRYFMTIPEAVQLIIRSGALAKGGEVYVLEMGD